MDILLETMKTASRRLRGLCLAALLLLPAFFPGADAAAAGTADDAKRPWSVEARLKRHFGSHSSYEFGNPFEPFQAPLSRLEFPMNVWWAGAELRRSFSRFSAGLEVLRSLSEHSDGDMEDSDWDDEGRPDLKTIYSHSSCRMETSFMVRADLDMSVADWLGLPAWFDLRPVVGIRWQDLEFTTHDGIQYDLGGGGPPDPLPGNGIRFNQIYWHYFAGLKAAYDLQRHTGAAPVLFFGQLDLSYTVGHNSDRHLLRPGNRWTFEDTRGHAWRASAGFKVALDHGLRAGLELEYLRVETSGSHRMEVFDISYGFDHGVKVWSEQKSLMLSLEYRF
jgi:outer membrane protease